MIVRYDPLNTPDPAAWLALDESERIQLVQDYHRRARVRLPNARVHASMHIVVETGPPSNMRLIGWDKNSLTPGDVVTLRVYLAKTGNPAGRLNKIILADGTELHDTNLGGDADGQTSYSPPSK